MAFMQWQSNKPDQTKYERWTANELQSARMEGARYSKEYHADRIIGDVTRGLKPDKYNVDAYNYYSAKYKNMSDAKFRHDVGR